MNVLCILARAPSPGSGKSRLRSRLGDAATDRLALAFVEDVLNWPMGVADEVVVAYDGAAELLPAGAWCTCIRQARGDLGDRIAGAVDACFDRGAERVVIIGTDCPTMPAHLLEAAFAGLSRASSTVVPATDGGWIALGVDRPLGGALADVEWSSALTGELTIAALSTDGRPPQVLSAWYDVDEPGDVDRVRADRGGRHRAPRTFAVLDQMEVRAS